MECIIELLATKKWSAWHEHSRICSKYKSFIRSTWFLYRIRYQNPTVQFYELIIWKSPVNGQLYNPKHYFLFNVSIVHCRALVHCAHTPHMFSSCCDMCVVRLNVPSHQCGAFVVASICTLKNTTLFPHAVCVVSAGCIYCSCSVCRNARGNNTHYLHASFN